MYCIYCGIKSVSLFFPHLRAEFGRHIGISIKHFETAACPSHIRSRINRSHPLTVWRRLLCPGPACKGGQTNICRCAVTPPRPHKRPSRHRRARQIYWATFGCVRAVGVDKAGHNVCHPITTEIYLPDRHILLQGPVCRLALRGRRQRRGGREGRRQDRRLQTAYYHQFDTVDS